MTQVDFYFGIGSRYSYLAAARIPALEAETGARVTWRAVYSRELIRRAGADPFAGPNLRGQYDPAYRTRDARRWAGFLGIPYVEPDFAALDSKPLALWSTAAELAGRGAAFGAAILGAVFGRDAVPRSQADLTTIANEAGLSAEHVAQLVESGAAAEAHEQSIEDALSAGAFGVPTFVTDDGELFWGQDRVPLLAHHLLERRRR
jgi:2-hydroxychromene-2-carboxylate isomerase